MVQYLRFAYIFYQDLNRKHRSETMNPFSIYSNRSRTVVAAIAAAAAACTRSTAMEVVWNALPIFFSSVAPSISPFSNPIRFSFLFSFVMYYMTSEPIWTEIIVSSGHWIKRNLFSRIASLRTLTTNTETMKSTRMSLKFPFNPSHLFLILHRRKDMESRVPVCVHCISTPYSPFQWRFLRLFLFMFDLILCVIHINTTYIVSELPSIYSQWVWDKPVRSQRRHCWWWFMQLCFIDSFSYFL